ncbi:hypothetical protein B296_00012740 [Ensete ventricosum]|uniref:Uncharacterized protein n=1 Tax=Ensete ventricosum TaxID=4639 RepID=A0A426YVI0_ENSVE|nr:hypothetical protein B296_00012740 [Ensete ventricosum]
MLLASRTCICAPHVDADQTRNDVSHLLQGSPNLGLGSCTPGEVGSPNPGAAIIIWYAVRGDSRHPKPSGELGGGSAGATAGDGIRPGRPPPPRRRRM